ncbi:MAG TPA: tail fiber protein [Longimicrobium sp.]|nr:tail fiber protein [Longimicrobium sp.]
MADPFVAEIRIFPFTFAPKGWAFCNGQILPISQNTALFSLLGTTYGGDGKSTFALPGLQGSSAMHPGQGQGLSLRDLGEIGGSESITLLQSEMPAHTHTLMGQATFGNSTDPTDKVWGRPFGGGSMYKASGTVGATAPQMIAPAGGDQPHNNMQPYLTLNFNIALQGVYPARP